MNKSMSYICNIVNITTINVRSSMIAFNLKW